VAEPTRLPVTRPEASIETTEEFELAHMTFGACETWPEMSVIVAVACTDVPAAIGSDIAIESEAEGTTGGTTGAVEFDPPQPLSVSRIALTIGGNIRVWDRTSIRPIDHFTRTLL
jgi:hypothetical protein